MNFDRYVGIPWRKHGTGFGGCTCWGLLHLIYREELGIELPTYSERYATAKDRSAVAALIADSKDEEWREVGAGDERTFDAVLLRTAGALAHVGIVIDPGRMLHVFDGAESEVASYHGGAWRHRVAGFYRHIAT